MDAVSNACARFLQDSSGLDGRGGGLGGGVGEREFSVTGNTLLEMKVFVFMCVCVCVCVCVRACVL